jgi:hypothetical protein
MSGNRALARVGRVDRGFENDELRTVIALCKAALAVYQLHVATWIEFSASVADCCYPALVARPMDNSP